MHVADGGGTARPSCSSLLPQAVVYFGFDHTGGGAVASQPDTAGSSGGAASAALTAAWTMGALPWTVRRPRARCRRRAERPGHRLRGHRARRLQEQERRAELDERRPRCSKRADLSDEPTDHVSCRRPPSAGNGVRGSQLLDRWRIDSPGAVQEHERRAELARSRSRLGWSLSVPADPATVYAISRGGLLWSEAEPALQEHERRP